jgi:hypothetical protein
MRKILEKCPTCSGPLAATQLSCTVCDTVIQGRYSPCPFCQLSPEDLAFMELFVKSRGNVKEMERDLGVSYWTIRGRLDEVIDSMGFEQARPERDQANRQRQTVLEQLERGDITVNEAADRLARL